MTQFKRIFIPCSQQDEVGGSNKLELENNFEKWVPINGEDTLSADKEIQEHLNDGWRIVSTCPIVGTFSLKSASQSDVTNNFVFTDGIDVFLVKG